jgi:cell division protein FtsW
VPFLVFYLILAVLFLLQPDMGSFVIIGVVGFFMYVIAGASWKNILLLLILGGLALSLFVVFAPYRLERVISFLNPQKNLREGSYQLHQSLIALGSGGLLGRGYGQSMQKFFGFLPEVMTDSVFSVLGEELGLIGTGSVVVSFLLFFYLATRIAKETEGFYGKLLVYGVGILITFQALYNIGAMIGVVPLSGLPLPFFSYGGSSLISTLVGAGVILSVARFGN